MTNNTSVQLIQDNTGVANHPPRILILVGSIRTGSYSLKLAEQAVHILQTMGADTQIYDSRELPLFDNSQTCHPKVQELRQLSAWSEGMLWICPEVHGNITGVFKNQIDWIPLSDGAIRPTQGKTLALMQISGGSQSFNVVNNMRILGRWMRMFTIPNQSSIPKAYQEFNQAGQLKDSPFKDRVIDVCEELIKMTLIIREQADLLNSRYSERKQAACCA